MSDPIAFLITFRTFGTWLPGDERGSVDHRRTGVDRWRVGPDASRENQSRARMTGPAVALDSVQRRVATAAIAMLASTRGWNLLALNVRSNHVHAVVAAGESPEQAMTTMKSAATKSLREAGLFSPLQRVWSRHGSTRYLWDEPSVDAAKQYTDEAQDQRDEWTTRS